jgi:sulfatase modifying factor 1
MAKGVFPRLVLLALAWSSALLGGCRIDDRPDRAGRRAETAPETIVTKTGVEMVLIPAGQFLMGDDNGEDDEKPVHPVRVGSFYMDVCEVTQRDYQSLMGRNPSKFVDPYAPVDKVSWHDAVRYCNMRSLREGFTPCYDTNTLKCDFSADGYRLPTEAEWEYACRAGTTSRWSFGNDSGKLAEYAWLKDNSNKTTHPVRQKAPNPWGLYDMHGNVYEWCNDFYREGYGQDSEGDDPRGPASGDKRVVRGGCWDTREESCRSSARSSESPGFVDVCFKREAYGFRCVRNAPRAATSPE